MTTTAGRSRSLGARYLAPAPPARLAVLRMLVGGFGVAFLVVRLPELLRVAALPSERFDPVGPWAFLSEPLPTSLVRVVTIAAVPLGVAFVVGWRYRVTGPAFALVLLGVAAYRSSWGQVFHTENLLVLHALVLGFASAADTRSLDRRRRGGSPPDAGSRHGWPVRLMAVVTVLTYVIAGWAKLRNGGWDWVAGDVLRNQVAFDNLRKVVVGDVSSPLGELAVAHAWLFPPLAWVSLAVELGAPLALLGGRIRTVWVVSAWCFHVGVLALMAIVFAYPLSGVAFAPLFAVERLPGRVAAVVRRRSGRRRDDGSVAPAIRAPD